MAGRWRLIFGFCIVLAVIRPFVYSPEPEILIDFNSVRQQVEENNNNININHHQQHWSRSVARSFHEHIGSVIVENSGDFLEGKLWESASDGRKSAYRILDKKAQRPVSNGGQPLLKISDEAMRESKKSPRICKIKQGEEKTNGGVECKLQVSPLAVVIPLPYTRAQLQYLESNMRSWTSPFYAPCDLSSSSSASLVDLVFYTGQDRFLEPMKESIENLITETTTTSSSSSSWRKCFRNIIYISAGLTEEDDVYAVPLSQRLKKPCGVVMMFESLFFRTDFAKSYQWMFWMEPDTRPLRPGWVDRLVLESSLAAADGIWSIGSAPQYELDACALPLFETLHINGNALYRLGDTGFNEFVKNARRQRPDSIDFGLYEYRMRCDLHNQNRLVVSRFRYSTMIMNSPKWQQTSMVRFLNSSDAHFAHGKETLGLLGGVFPCGTLGNQLWPVNGQSILLCPNWNSSLPPLPPPELDFHIQLWKSLPRSPWGTNLSKRCKGLWEPFLKKDDHYEEAKFHLYMRVNENREEWCWGERKVRGKGRGEGWGDFDCLRGE